MVEPWGVARRDAPRRVAQVDWLGLAWFGVWLACFGLCFGVAWLGVVLAWLGLAWLLWFRVARRDASRRVAQPDATKRQTIKASNRQEQARCLASPRQADTRKSCKYIFIIMLRQVLLVVAHNHETVHVKW